MHALSRIRSNHFFDKKSTSLLCLTLQVNTEGKIALAGNRYPFRSVAQLRRALFTHMSEPPHVLAVAIVGRMACFRTRRLSDYGGLAGRAWRPSLPGTRVRAQVWPHVTRAHAGCGSGLVFPNFRPWVEKVVGINVEDLVTVSWRQQRGTRAG